MNREKTHLIVVFNLSAQNHFRLDFLKINRRVLTFVPTDRFSLNLHINYSSYKSNDNLFILSNR